MTPDRRAQVARSIDLTFRQVISEAEYEELQQAAQYRGCPVCRDTFLVAEGLPGPNARLYCSEKCVETRERETAPMIKPQSAAPLIDGWAV